MPRTGMSSRSFKGEKPGGSVIIISGPNENSQKASISVNVLAAKSQDEVYAKELLDLGQKATSKHEY